MKFMVEYPLGIDDEGRPWATPSSMVAFATALEAAGVDAIAFTDHPAPSKKWLDGGGHATIDPFVGLGFCAGVTTTLRLMTALTVVPYRNPLLLAKSMTAVDIVSGGRATFILGTGYLRSEFLALGVDFEERNALFDEAVEVAKGLWSTEELQYEGRHFTALGQTMFPRQVQQPHPPLWLGGNARIVRDRVARWGDGWAPMLGGGVLTQTARTAAITTDQDFADALDDLGERLERHGRSLSDVDISGSIASTRVGLSDPPAFVGGLAELAKLGVTWTHAPVVLGNLTASLEAIAQFGEEVMAKL
ncbi:MAG TPA: LLM class F420-dependent oxidoreductase [Acidimicrobiales bacterium]|jgi:probable F420-dependent oxidoreductase|nr:LLM class F420-dependent oxidoreductase [Acidimicrobiales bacterium]